ncbi:molybdopterin molybdotransferase MoeA [Neorhodopirellula lusitana]|uniref:molybdopterin molybdotransferase MoeA n=1 Tax=Neorhodopirellula lusitana TaxID=445327 RepID=UPI00384FFC6D
MIQSPDSAIEMLAARLVPLASENFAPENPASQTLAHESISTQPINSSLIGRVLAEPILADRDSPPADVSAMDGYAVFPGQIDRQLTWPVIAESAAGSRPPNLNPETASQQGVIRIFTGAMVPVGCDRVIQREHTIEQVNSDSPDTVEWTDKAKSITAGTNIRRQGENQLAGGIAVPAGRVIQGPQAAAITSVGASTVSVYRLVRVAIITTGDELASRDDNSETLPPWMIRNSNAEALLGILNRCPYAAPPTVLHGPDEPEELKAIIEKALATHEVVLLTGGVSMGDRDYVPTVLNSIGAETLFHRLPLRPGKPILGAVHQLNSKAPTKLIIGLPGNPVSATMGVVRFALPLIARLGGVAAWRRSQPTVTLVEVGTKTLPMHWMRAVRLVEPAETGKEASAATPGLAELVIGKGSGDLLSLAQSDGFIEMPPHANNTGPWPFYAWG